MIRRPPRSTQSRSSAASDVYKRQVLHGDGVAGLVQRDGDGITEAVEVLVNLSLIHISEPTRLGMISYAVFCLKKKKKTNMIEGFLRGIGHRILKPVLTHSLR